jgi:hypothetical protein
MEFEAGEECAKSDESLFAAAFMQALKSGFERRFISG